MEINHQTFLPNLFILGAAKSGTTTLYNYFKNMPDICMSIPKEPFFFEAYYEKGLEFYYKHYFKHWNNEPIIGEARHRNLIQPYVPKRIWETNPNAKLIVIARNPVDRAYSHWYHNYVRNTEKLNFKKAILADLKRIEKGLDCSTPEEIEKHCQKLKPFIPQGKAGLGIYRTYIDTGYYYIQIKRYLDLFPKENLKLIIFENFVLTPEPIIQDIVNFLNIDSQRNKFQKNLKINDHHTVKKEPNMTFISKLYQKNPYAYFFNKITPELIKNKLLGTNPKYEMDTKTKLFLKQHYYQHNKNLETLFNINLDIWNT